MPARKNRPDKYPFTADYNRKRQDKLDGQVRTLALKLADQEKREPKHDHWVSWLDMEAAREMVKRGLIVEGHRATGCFYITDKFRTDFHQELR